MIKAVLFDYGETIVRPRRRWSEMRPKALRGAYLVMKRSGLDVGFDKFLEANETVFSRYFAIETGRNMDISDIVKYRELVAELFPRRPTKWRENVARRSNQAFWKVVKYNYVLSRNARSALVRLNGMGIAMSVISNHHNPEELTRHLDQLRVSKYFSPIIASAGTNYRKPDSRIFKMCLKAMKVAPSQAVFVGDSMENDIAGAKGVGLRAILVATSPLGKGASSTAEVRPDFTIRELGEVPRIISGLS